MEKKNVYPTLIEKLLVSEKWRRWEMFHTKVCEQGMKHVQEAHVYACAHVHAQTHTHTHTYIHTHWDRQSERQRKTEYSGLRQHFKESETVPRPQNMRGAIRSCRHNYWLSFQTCSEKYFRPIPCEKGNSAEKEHYRTARLRKMARDETRIQNEVLVPVLFCRIYVWQQSTLQPRNISICNVSFQHISSYLAR